MGKAELKVEIDAEVLAQARAAGLTLDEIAEAAIRARLAARPDAEKAAGWAETNAEALAAQRARIDAHGVFGDALRTW